MMTETNFNPRRLLEQELARRCAKNSRYSIRSFAKSLGVSHTFLAMLLSGKRSFTQKTLDRVADVLNLNPAERVELLSFEQKSAKKRKAQKQKDHNLQLSLEIFSVISDWYHYGILNLLKLPDFKSDVKWVAKRLGITQAQAKLAVERLKRLDFITEDDNGRWQRTIPDIKIDNQIFSAACRKFQGQLLDKAKESLENDPFDARVAESFTLVMDSSQIPYARNRLREVSKELAGEFEGLGHQDEVYNLCVQIYPVSKSDKNKNKKEKSDV